MKLPLSPALLCCTPCVPEWLWQFPPISRNLEDAEKHLLTPSIGSPGALQGSLSRVSPGSQSLFGHWQPFCCFGQARAERDLCCVSVTNWEQGCWELMTRVKNNTYFVKIYGSKECLAGKIAVGVVCVVGYYSGNL